ncbi:DUF4126 domain-containing protein [Ralstonia insidiosa]|jgi:hypothetical protein|uniref:DUF4126 domain-containing protein n=1 Tax=Ralstonia insidiosa TaxID=190721 RepID=A0A191ZZ14_9RALS|nr:DUF4126 domain-containing protein [Ralstonia insidiosa]ANJ73369.1 hypothetical protein A9Y76_13195 [Ralstonia insidiosa]KAB0473739.1 DUF4126 domain-containing protein [Ralstonia insidiosa]MBY4911162.1 DUF4126 domain-containing protein [Ralstonia insidiosa]
MLETAALAAGLSWTSGFRLYLAVFAAGMLGRTGWLHLPPGLQMLESWWVIGLAGVLAVAEFLADKIPGFDSVWDSIQTFIRIPAGAILAAAAFGQLDPQWMVAAGLIGGTLAGTAHATKAGTRALINASPEPFSNWAASFSEDITATGGLLMSFFLPAAFLVVLAILLLVAVWLLPKLWRGVRRLRDALRGRTSEPPAAGPTRLPH